MKYMRIGRRRPTLTQSGVVCSFRQGEKIFSAGEVGSCFYIVLSGEVELQMEMRDGSLVHVETVKKSGHFGEGAMFSDAPRVLFAVAAVDVMALRISKEKFLEFIENQPEVTFSLMRSMYEKQERTHKL